MSLKSVFSVPLIYSYEQKMARLASAITASPGRTLAYQNARVLWLLACQHVNQCKELLELEVANT
jgi:hypothetical protein